MRNAIGMRSLCQPTYIRKYNQPRGGASGGLDDHLDAGASTDTICAWRMAVNPPSRVRPMVPLAHFGAKDEPFKSSVLGRAQTGRNTGVVSVIALQQHLRWLQSAHIQALPCGSDSSTCVTRFVWMLLSSTRESCARAGIDASVNTTAKSRMMLRQASIKRFTVNPLAPFMPNADVCNT